VTNQYFRFGNDANVHKLHSETLTGKEAIFSLLDEGDIKIADLCLDDMYKMPRFDPVKISPPITWEEDPDPTGRYWRLNFYGLRFTTNLLYAGTETGNSAYYDKLLEIIDSFINDGMNKSHSWDDFNGVAWRTMVLTNTWLKLHEQNALPDETSTKILEALEVHGDFLANVHHYQPEHNHGITESAALLFLSTSIPDMPGAEEWSSIAKDRIAKQLDSIVDEGGVLTENSPYYHFIALQLYREIYIYAMQHTITISDGFGDKIEKMISYGTYILQPNLEIPLLGASIERKLNLAGQYEQMAISDPYLLYVLTEGKQGKVPPSLNKYYPAAGQTIMRSGWGKGTDFEKQTQIIFDVGNYRTTHSDLDALSFNLYSNGITLMPDAGLYAYPPFYAYEEVDPYWSYFRGTSAHNTVVVDGMDQKPYSAETGVFLEGEGYAYQSAEHELYDGVSHQRAVALLGHNLVLIVDHLISDKEHKYEQMFHLFPEASLDVNGLTVTGSSSDPNQSVTIYQLLPEGIAANSVKGQDSPPDGWCSKQFGVAIPNYCISYEQHGKVASYITLLEIGQHDKNMVAEVSADQSTVNVHSSEKDYSIKITRSAASEKKLSIANNDNVPLPEETVIETFQNAGDWAKENRSGHGGSILVDKTDYSVGGGSLQLTSPADGSYMGAVKNISLDLSDKNIIFRMKVTNIQDVNTLELSLSNDNWKSYMTINLKNRYRVEYDSEWITVALGKGESNQWRKYGSVFDWSNIGKVRFRIGAEEGTVATLRLDRLSTTPGQKEGAVIIVFDDGSETISAAADIMNNYGLKGNVAVISQRLASNVRHYLTLEALIELQDVYGWNVVNHSEYHKNALSTYYDNNDMAGLENDILTGAECLIKYGINSAPNWYIYPNGATNSEVKEIVGKYYKFARLDSGAPDVFPFGEPLAVRALQVADNTTVDEVKRQVLDAQENKLTLFITFHKIKTSSTENVGYDITDFEKIISYISEQGIKVKTLSELDKDNGVSMNQLTITDAIPEQIVLDVKINKIGLLQKMLNKISGH
jgi:hypothetical protein